MVFCEGSFIYEFIFINKKGFCNQPTSRQFEIVYTYRQYTYRQYSMWYWKIENLDSKV